MERVAREKKLLISALKRGILGIIRDVTVTARVNVGNSLGRGGYPQADQTVKTVVYSAIFAPVLWYFKGGDHMLL